ncbi:hypothetical protein J5S49_13935 [Virgibacillus halodenitrificans]|nr:hypothetical protein [Virgibacillus halodenitrificans]MCG1029393.1 hypothetical protein [Virgibacillus halodenitrificans]
MILTFLESIFGNEKTNTKRQQFNILFDKFVPLKGASQEKDLAPNPVEKGQIAEERLR